MFKKILCALLIVLALSTCIITVSAAPNNVEYSDKALNYVFSLEPRADLFANFKRIMPGDHKTQVIALQNTEKNKNITIYLRAEVFEEYKEFLNYMTLKIYKSDSVDGKKVLISENKASEPGALATDVKLAKLSPGQLCYITVELDVDKAMGNDQALKEGVIRWIFSSEEEVINTPTKPSEPTKPSKPTKPSEPTKPSKPITPTNPDKTNPTKKPIYRDTDELSPHTGDSIIETIVAAVVVFISAFLIILLTKKDKNDKQNKKPRGKKGHLSY